MAAYDFSTPSLPNEGWREHTDYPFYFISNRGRIINTRFGEKLLCPSPDTKGYLRITLRQANGVRKGFAVHRLVARLFLGDPPERDATVNHKNGKKRDNRIENLEYMTRRENTKHAQRLGLMAHGEQHYQAKLTAKDIKMIRKYIKGEFSERFIAKQFNVTKTVIRSIKLGLTWKHISP